MLSFLIQVFRQIGQEPVSGKALVLSVFGCMLPGTLCLLCGFFCLLHSWLNAFAEMLRFADRMFYQVSLSITTYLTFANPPHSINRIGGILPLMRHITELGTLSFMIGCTLISIKMCTTYSADGIA